MKQVKKKMLYIYRLNHLYLFSTLFRKKSISQILGDVTIHEQTHTSLNKNLRVIDLTGMGIAAVIGAGIFSTIGTAAAHGGPAVSLLFLFTALACAFSAMCYARFASIIPICGSAYTYAYASFGELIAWIIGWDLIMEYAIGNIAVAISWSDYFSGFINGVGIHIPEYLLVDYLSASRGYHAALLDLAKGIPFDQIAFPIREAYHAWLNAPVIGGLRLIADIPAFSIVVFICTLVYIGIYETKITANLMVLVKVSILLIIIAVGSFYIDPENWTPFAPNGISGVLKGVSGVFFAYIGFDAISTTAEECRNPRRDLPKAIIYALIITTILYIAISMVLTGMVNFTELAVGDPLAYAFNKLHLTKLSGIIAISAIIAMAGVLLVFQVGQPRIWMSMSRDGLLPQAFGRIHHRFRTPWFATIVSGIFVAIPSLFMNLTEVTDLCSIGTLFAFVIVSGGVIVLDQSDKKRPSPMTNYTNHADRTNHTNLTTPSAPGFTIPYFNSRYLLPLVWIGISLILFVWNPSELSVIMGELNDKGDSVKFSFHMDLIPLLLFLVIAVVITIWSMIKQFSLIPVLGLLTNLYLMAQLGITNWLRFGIWLTVGLVIYFTFSRKHSKLKVNSEK
jgi:basic amino acid/polyamine antiporter, APA family